MQNEILLVQRAKSGDLPAFEQLVTLHSRRTYSAAYRILNNQAWAEDCTQEVFLKVFNKIKDFDGKSKFSTWLYSVTVFTALDLQRKQSKLQQREGGEFEDIHACDSQSPQQQLQQDKLNQVTQRALGQLSEELRVAFLLRHHEGCSIKEISEILDVNGNTIKNRIFRAISQLKNLLKSKVSDYETVD